jgi:hypothetical protein
MPRRGSLVATVALTAAVLPVLPAQPATAAPPPSGPATSSGPATPSGPATSGPATTTVTLITGDAVRYTPGAVPRVAVLPRDAAAGGFRTARAGDRVSVIPVAVSPYLGARLDPALFDVTALAAAPAGRLPVRVTYRAGAAHRALPGVTVTASTGDTATGYLTPASARDFGAALSPRLFDGIASIRYAGTVRPAAQPRFPMFTLRIPVLDATGAPALSGSVAVVNVDDAAKYVGFAYVEDGEARVSVPAGNYGLLAETAEFDDTGITQRLVHVADVAVTAATTLPPVDMRTATAAGGVTVPRPARTDEVTVDWTREAVGGGGLSWSLGTYGDSRILVAPGRAVRHGSLRWGNYWRLSAEDDSYTYDLKWSADGAIPARQRFTVTAADVTTLSEHYYSDVPRQSWTARWGLRPGELAFATLYPIRVPRARTEYLAGSANILWLQSHTGVLESGDDYFIVADDWYDGSRRYRPGEKVTVRWARGPVHPSLAYDTGLDPYFGCPACRTGDAIGFFVTPLADTVPGHAGYLDAYGDTPLGRIDATSRYRVYRGTTLLLDETGGFGAEFAVPAAAARYRVVHEQTRTAPWIRHGTAATTEWTFRSGRPATGTAPERWFCPEGDGECAVLPVLTASYDVPTDGRGRVAAGPGPVTVTVAPTQGAPAMPVDRVTLSWSADDGATWTPVTGTALGDNRFAFTLPNPSGAFVSLKVSGTDRAGATITQTLTRAYSVR